MLPIVFWELCNLKESFVYEIELYNEEDFNRYIEKTIHELNILFNSLKNTFFNLFKIFLLSSKLLLINFFSLTKCNYSLCYISKFLTRLG